MGTNYYARPAPCPSPCSHCTQPEVHIGKSLVMFEAHDVSPWGVIHSWADWKRALRSPGVTITDEYGAERDVEAFIADVEATSRAHRRRQHDAVRDNYPTTYASGRDWLDPDGFSFTRGEFS